MNRTLILLVAAATSALAAPGFDFRQLDKLGARAKDSTSINLEGPVLKMASRLLRNDKDPELRALVDGLSGIYIRTFEFDESGRYKESDLEPLRSYLDEQHWAKIVDVKERHETSAIYVLTLPDNQPGGLAIVACEPKELTVVFIEGKINMDNIGRLSGTMGIPDMMLLRRAARAKKKSDAADAK